MGKEKINTTKLGLFVTAAVILFTIAVYFIGSRQNLFAASFGISTTFQNVNGLQAGNNVRYSGIDVGVVDRIVIINDSTIRVEMMLERKVQAFLKSDALASIGTDGLVGNMIVNINPGKGNGEEVMAGGVIPSYSRFETDDMMNALGKTTENIALLTLRLLEITEAIHQGEGTIATLLYDSNWANQLEGSLQYINQSSQHLAALTGQFQRSMEDVEQGQGVLGYLLNDTTLEERINHITQNLDTLLISRTQPIMSELEVASKEIASTSTALKEIIQGLDVEEGMVGTVFKDSIAADELKQIIHNLNEGTYRFNENMEALKHNFFFRKYFKKQEKLRKKEERGKEVTVGDKPS